MLTNEITAANRINQSGMQDDEVVMNPIRSPSTSPQYSISKKLNLGFADLSALAHPAKVQHVFTMTDRSYCLI